MTSTLAPSVKGSAPANVHQLHTHSNQYPSRNKGFVPCLECAVLGVCLLLGACRVTEGLPELENCSSCPDRAHTHTTPECSRATVASREKQQVIDQECMHGLGTCRSECSLLPEAGPSGLHLSHLRPAQLEMLRFMRATLQRTWEPVSTTNLFLRSKQCYNSLIHQPILEVTLSTSDVPHVLTATSGWHAIN